MEHENQWRNEWGGKMLFSHGSNHSRGVAVLFSKQSQLVIDDYRSSNDGRILLVKTKQDDSYIYLVNIYAPNTETAQIHFFKQLITEMTKFGINAESDIILAGDFNVPLSPLDKTGGKLILKTKVIEQIENIASFCELHDNWRVRNPALRRYTWRQRHEQIQCRLDYFLISHTLQDCVIKAEIIPAVKTDHSAIKIALRHIVDQPHGKGYWKFNASLIGDPDYTNKVKENIRTWKQEIEGIDPRYEWEYVKYKTRPL